MSDEKRAPGRPPIDREGSGESERIGVRLPRYQLEYIDGYAGGNRSENLRAIIEDLIGLQSDWLNRGDI